MLYKIFKHVMIVLGVGCLFVSSVQAAYTLGAGDTIRISVYGEEELSFDEYLIDSSETLDYPYVGVIELKDKTPKNVQGAIAAGLKGGYLTDPKVTVNIVKYRNIYINGVVNQPGGYEYQPDLTVQKAIALAGGFLAKYRKTKGIYLTKADEIKGLTQDEIEDLLDNKKRSDLNDPVGPGDTIYVVSSFW
ncbi:polysaccharide biosynthesis/export family protein [Vibrio sp. WJH972]